MTIIEASSGTYRSRVDGTIVLSVEIEPRFRSEALTLFGMPGTPIALAALRVASSKPQAKASNDEAGAGYWCLQAVSRCREAKFWQWIAFATMQGQQPTDEEAAAQFVREVCGIESRSELDTDQRASECLRIKILEPYRKWLSTAAK